MSTTSHEYEGNFPTLRAVPSAIGRGIRWLWRKTWRYSLSLLVLLIITHTILNIIAGRRLEAELQKIRAAGQPLTLVEAAPPQVPDEQNAAGLYLYVFRGTQGPIDVKQQLNQKWAGWDYKTFLGADEEVISSFAKRNSSEGAKQPSLSEVKTALARHERQISLIRQASLMPYCRFPINWQDGAETLFPHLAGVRGITRYLSTKALVDAKFGNAPAAYDDLATALRAINQVCNNATIIDQLVRVACLNIIASALPDILSAAPPNETQVRALDVNLQKLDTREPLTKAMEGERRFGLWAFDYVRRKGPHKLSGAIEPGQLDSLQRLLDRSWPVLRFIGEPFIKFDQVYYLQYMQRQIDLTKKPYVESRTGYDTLYGESNDIPKNRPWYSFISLIIMPVFSQAGMKSDEGLAQIELMRAAIALRSYQIKHGSYPATLAELRADGFPVATDPFTGKDYVYRREGKGYLIYSLGKDQKDQKGMRYGEAMNLRRSSGAVMDYDIPFRMTR